MMHSLPAKIYSVAAVREIDRIAIEEQGVPGYTLMQRAAAAAVREARERYPQALCWQAICGAGNNGGDGYVVARLAILEGVSASVVTLVDPESLSGDAETAHDDFVAAGGTVTPWNGGLAEDADLLVDAMLGSGLERDVAGSFADAVNAANAHPAPIHALDIATGIDGDTGEVRGCAVKADVTTTFVGLKAGLFLGAGPDYCGTVTFSGLDIDAAAYRAVEPSYCRPGAALLKRVLPPRQRSAHKGNFGHVVVLGGGPGMPGAALLCGEAALRTGAGRVSVATHPEHAAVLAAVRPELMSRGIRAPEDLAAILESADVVAFGPGLGRSPWARALFPIMAADRRPAVWDADALNLLAEKPATAANRIITPHPGEAATLTGTDSSAIQADRPAALRALAREYGGIVVLKGAGTLISGSSGIPAICTSGNPGMAAPGMGDVLTGVIAALLAQGLSPERAALAGVELHARAGDLAARKGQRGLMASDLIAALRELVNP